MVIFLQLFFLKLKSFEIFQILFLSCDLRPLNFYPISFYFYFLILWKQFYFWYTSLLLFPGPRSRKSSHCQPTPSGGELFYYFLSSLLVMKYCLIYKPYQGFYDSYTYFYVSVELLLTQFPLLMLSTCSEVLQMRQILFHHYFLFFHLFPRCAQETPGMFWDPDWLLLKYSVAIVYFPFRIHMISFNSICRGHPNSAKSSLFPNRLKWRQFRLSFEWGKLAEMCNAMRDQKSKHRTTHQAWVRSHLANILFSRFYWVVQPRVGYSRNLYYVSLLLVSYFPNFN